MEDFKTVITRINDLVPLVGIPFNVFKLAYPKNLSKEHEESVDQFIEMLLDSYLKSVLFQNKTLEEKERQIKVVDERTKVKDERIKFKEERIKFKEEQIKEKDEQIKEKDEQIKGKDEQIKEKEKRIKEKDDMVKLLKESVDPIGALREMNKAGPRRKWGSTTRTQAWDRLNKKGAVTFKPRVTNSGSQNPQWRTLSSELTDLKNTSWGTEVEMYKGIISAIEENLYPDKKLHVVDTHKSQHYPADISIAEHSGELLPYSLLYFLEMKLPAIPIETSDFRGQVLDYLHMAHEKQPHRSEFVGILSNLDRTLVYVATYDSMDEIHIVEEFYDSLANALLFADMLSKSQFRVALPTLDGALGEKFSVLATRNHYFLLSVQHLPTTQYNDQRSVGNGEFRVPVRHDKGSNKFVLKITHDNTSMAHERRILEKFIEDPSPYVPEIVWFHEANNQLGITPIGRSVRPGGSAATSRKVVEGLIEGLRYLHGLQIVHRDIRLANLILKGTRLNSSVVIIDFETAYDFSQEQLEVDYEGGCICWPRRLLEAEMHREDEYMPEPEDDLFASILVVLHLMFPDRFDQFNVGNIDPSKGKDRKGETFQLLQTWEAIEKSTVWGRFYIAAKERRYDELLEMADFFCHV